LPSAFRARSIEGQPLPAGALTIILFGEEQFDLSCEYDPETSTFTPKQSGIYTLQASINFAGNNPEETVVTLAIIVNNEFVTADIETLPNGNGVLDTSTIVQLKAGDKVQVGAFVFGTSGTVVGGIATRFEGSRLNQ
jgi:hypothetical protein